HDTKRCKQQVKPKEKAVWVTVGKGKETVSQFFVAPPANAVPSASNLPIMQQIVPEVLEDGHKVGDSDVLSPQELGVAQGPDVPPTCQQGEDMPREIFQDIPDGASEGKVFFEDPQPSMGGYTPLFIREEPRDKSPVTVKNLTPTTKGSSAKSSASRLLGSAAYDNPVDFNTIKNAIQNILPQQSSDAMCREVTDEEVKDAMWSLPANKAPGPDAVLRSISSGCYWKVPALAVSLRGSPVQLFAAGSPSGAVLAFIVVATSLKLLQLAGFFGCCWVLHFDA
ncbi:hypothetical protein U1Q18_013514, partial [Sarracenia purpurea var. burkii]